MERKVKVSKIDINKKFRDFHEANLYAKKLKQWIECYCRKEQGMCQGIISVSNIIGGTTNNIHNEKTNNAGRPKIVKEVASPNGLSAVFFGKGIECGKPGELGNIYNDYHIHVFLISKPGETLRKMIKEYIKKNWYDIEELYTFDEDNNLVDRQKPVYPNDANINYVTYMFEQSESNHFIDINCTNEAIIPNGYSLKKFYSEYLKINTDKLYGEDYYIRGKKEILERKYKEMYDYYYALSSEYNKKLEDQFNKNNGNIYNRNNNKKRSKEIKQEKIEDLFNPLFTK